jgi:hypothetical protein
MSKLYFGDRIAVLNVSFFGTEGVHIWHYNTDTEENVARYHSYTATCCMRACHNLQAHSACNLSRIADLAVDRIPT